MNPMNVYLFARSFVSDRKGVTALEYGLNASLIAAAIVGAVGLLGTEVGNVFDRVRTGMAPAAG